MKRAAVMLFLVLAAGAVRAQVTNPYHFGRTFIPVTNTPGAPTTYRIILGAKELTGIVGPTNIFIRSNETYATEYEGFSWGYESAEAAWTSAFAIYPNYSTNYSGMTYDNVGWIKGTRQAYGDWGAFVWLLQNTIAFTSSASSVYVSPGGATSTIASVLVGTLGDYCPQTFATEIGPVFNTNYPGTGTGTDEVFRADLNAYYKLVPFTYLGVNNDDSDADGIPDFADGFNQFGGTSDKSTNDFFTPWRVQLSSNASPTQALIRITYDASDPAGVTASTNGYAVPTNGYFRFWTKQGFKERNKAAVTNGGDYIPSGTYPATNLGFNATNRIVELYIEPVSPTTNREIVIEVDPDGTNTTKGFVCQDKLLCGVLSVILEPITIRPGNGSDFPLYNSSGIQLGSNATYEIQVNPSNIPNNHIVWRASTGIVSFVAGNTGRVVTVQAISSGAERLEVDIENFSGARPTIDLLVRTSTIVHVSVAIVTDGITPATTEARITNLLAGANQLYEQAGTHFQIQGAVQYITNAAWLDISSASFWLEFKLLTSTTSGTSGVEIYFVDTIDSSTNTTGANLGPGSGVTDGLVLTDAANFRTAGHELGHAGTLKDIYVSDSGSVIPGDLANPAWAPRDWNSGSRPQYYQTTLTHSNLLLRVLMNGRPSEIKSDVPIGRLYGVRVGGVLDWVEVGLQDYQVPRHD